MIGEVSLTDLDNLKGEDGALDVNAVVHMWHIRYPIIMTHVCCTLSMLCYITML